MRPQSAAEAIQPAIQRTRTVLFQPFQMGRSWKLAAAAYLSALGAFFIPTPIFSFFAKASQPHATFPSLLLSMGFGTIFSIVMFVFFYLGARMEFVLFDIVLLNEKFVAPSWRRHGNQAWRWVGFKMLFSIALSILLGPLFYLAYRAFMAQMPIVAPPGQPPSPQLFHTLFGFYALIGIPIVLAMISSSLLTNFVLPSIALEDTTVREGLRRTLGLFRSEPGPVSLFVVLKVLLGLAAFMAMETAIFLSVIVCLIPIVLIGAGGWLLLRSAGDAGHLMMLAGAILLGGVFGVFAVYIGMLAKGCVQVFFQAYALYFLGGRYPMLGDLLEPPTPPIPYALPPPEISPAGGPMSIPPTEPAV
jgi:hypothetical protein